MPEGPEKTDIERIDENIKSLEDQATELLDSIKESEEADADSVKETQEKVDALTEQVETLTAERDAAVAKASMKAMEDQIETLTDRFEQIRKVAPRGFNPATGTADDGAESEAIYGEHGDGSFFRDVKAATAGNAKAWERLDDAKAMTEGTDSSGGFLVPPDISDELIRLRDAGGVLRNLIPSQQITVDELRIAAVDNGLAVAWTAELAEKIQSQFTFSELSANVFTAAGLSVASNQLLADNKFNVDQMIFADFAKRFVSLEETAFLNGSGTGQPLGIRKTAGVTSIPLKGTKATDLIDAITDAVTTIYTEYFGGPNAIVMHPRTWGFLVKAREEGTPNGYVVGAPSTIYGRNPGDNLPGYTGAPLPRGELLGLPVYTSPNVPTNLGEGEESCVFVGNWSEALILDREGITTATSEHVFFTSNQTVFRSEERVGFSAARYPKAFAVVEGSGLKGH